MGLGANFKKYVAATFPECVASAPPQPPPEAVVVDVMVCLHAHTVRAEAPAQWLAQCLLFALGSAPVSALCFDVSATTPSAKSLEWAERPKPAVEVTAADVEAALAADQLPDLPSLIANREARTVLCRWLVKRIAELQWWGRTLLVLDDGTPTVYRTSATGERTVERRPDLARSQHGEADISTVFAANVLHSQFGAGVVELATCDTDIVLIGCLNAFEGLRVKLTHFDHATKQPVMMWVDCAALARAAPERYRVALMEWAALVASKGTDYIKSMIHGVGDWDVYLAGCAEALNDVKRSRGGRPLVSDESFEAQAMHTVFVAASERMKRARVKYDRDDGTLARLAWNTLYFRHAPHRGGAGLDCGDFGWRTGAAGVELRAGPPQARYGLGGVNS